MNCSCRTLRDLQAAAGNAGEEAVPVISVIFSSSISNTQTGLPSIRHRQRHRTALCSIHGHWPNPIRASSRRRLLTFVPFSTSSYCTARLAGAGQTPPHSCPHRQGQCQTQPSKNSSCSLCKVTLFTAYGFLQLHPSQHIQHSPGSTVTEMS